MRANKILYGFLILALLLQTAYFQVALPNIVLCFGDDDHIAFEWRDSQGICEHSSLVNNRVLSATTSGHSETHNMECTDLSLHFHPAYASEVTKKQVQKVHNLSYIRLYNAIQMANTKQFFESHITKSFSQSSHRLLQSTIILI
ncbi:MAG TPA: hypothetical protein ENK44_11275 [Caldithrix abyssi]|uniref:Uncharacterized protein n=1 Tax=Caldithrix abyssi TaxID=187145 RepID=A0A7V4U278_CALAY|nr:hypothetical protein [Caldithrix abyssi]